MVKDKIQFYPMDITYKIVNEKPHIYLFGKTIDKKQITIIDENFQPYFYVLLKNETNLTDFQEKVEKSK